MEEKRQRVGWRDWESARVMARDRQEERLMLWPYATFGAVRNDGDGYDDDADDEIIPIRLLF